LNTQIKILPAILFLFLLSCKDHGPDCFKSTGKTVTEDRSLTPFKTIFLKDNLNLIITDDTIQKVSVEAGEHLLSEIRTEVKNGQLFISNDNSCNWVRSYKKPLNVYLSLKNVIDIFHYGSGDITSQEKINKDTIIFHLYTSGNININMNSNYIWLDMDKLGDFTLSGKTHSLVSYTIGLGKLNTTGLACQDFYQKNDSQGSSDIHSDSLLRVEINNSGNIYYTGTPSVVSRMGGGSGNLIKQ
jgi:hypothetical protein